MGTRSLAGSPRSVPSAAATFPVRRSLPGGTGRSSTRTVEVPGRGRVVVQRFSGPPGAPTVVLLHGWTATADLNWREAYRPLSRHFHVVAFDHHGHGRGVRSREPFRLEHCADDVAAIADALGVRRLIVAGYSMGGPIASLVWRRHPELVDGLVLCATSCHFGGSPTRRALFTLLGGGASLSANRHLRAFGRLPATAWSKRLERRGCDAGLIEQGLAHDWTRVLEAGAAIGRFDSRAWAGTIDVPTAVVTTLGDQVVPTDHQLELADLVPDAIVHRVPGGHTACVAATGHFSSEVVAACRAVARRVVTRGVGHGVRGIDSLAA